MKFVFIILYFLSLKPAYSAAGMECEIVELYMSGKYFSYYKIDLSFAKIIQFLDFFATQTEESREFYIPLVVNILVKTVAGKEFVKENPDVITRLNLSVGEKELLLTELRNGNDGIAPKSRVVLRIGLEESRYVISELKDLASNGTFADVVLQVMLDEKVEKSMIFKFIQNYSTEMITTILHSIGKKLTDIFPDEDMRFNLLKYQKSIAGEHDSKLKFLDEFQLTAAHTEEYLQSLGSNFQNEIAAYRGINNGTHPPGMSPSDFQKFLNLWFVKTDAALPKISLYGMENHLKKLFSIGKKIDGLYTLKDNLFELSDQQFLDFFREIDRVKHWSDWEDRQYLVERLTSVQSQDIFNQALNYLLDNRYKFSFAHNESDYYLDASAWRRIVEGARQLKKLHMLRLAIVAPFLAEEAKMEYFKTGEQFQALSTLYDALKFKNDNDRATALSLMAERGYADFLPRLRSAGLPYEIYVDLLFKYANISQGDQNGFKLPLNLKDAEAKKLATILADNGRRDFFIENTFGLTDEQNFALLVAAINKAKIEFSSESISSVFCQKNPYCFNSDQSFQMAMAVFKRSPTIDTYQAIDGNLVFPVDVKRKFYVFAFVTEPGFMLNATLGENIHEGLPWDAPDGLPSLKSALLRLSERIFPVVSKANIEPLSLPSQRRNNILHLLRVAYELVDYDVTKVNLTDPYGVINRTLGFQTEPLKKVSSNRRGDLLAIAFDIQKATGKVPLKDLKISNKMYQKDELVDLLAALRDILFIRTEKTFDETIQEFGLLGRDIDATVAKDIVQKMRQAIVDEVVKLFGNTKINFTYEEYMRIRSEWGDLEPFESLVANFKRSNVPQEIDLLGLVFKKVVDGKFYDYKFNGDTDNQSDLSQAALQLESLKTPEQKTAWTKIRSKLSTYMPGNKAKNRDLLAERMKTVKNSIADTLEPHLKVSGQAQPSSEMLNAIVTAKTSPEETWEQLLTNPQLADEAMALKILVATVLNTLKVTSDATEMKKVAAFLKGNVNELAEILNFTATEVQQVKNDLTSIAITLSPDEPGENDQSIVFTTTFNHPRMMITIGDLVCTTSCQNYRTGSAVRTLLGYVVDANVQGLASYSLKKSRDITANDFDRLMVALNAGTDVQTEFDAGKKIVTFKFQDASGNVEFKSNQLGYAVLRRTIKLGQTDTGTAGVFLERAYEQPDSSSSVTYGHVDQIYKELSADLGQDGKAKQIVIRRTRNNPDTHGGVYSDAAGGVKTTDYTIELK